MTPPTWKNFRQHQILDSALSGERGPDQQRIAETCCSIAELLLRKNTDYGGSAWRVPVLAPTLDIGTAILCRASDKIARLSRLLAGTPSEVDESIMDTMLDLAGYLILWLARPRSTEAHAFTEPSTAAATVPDRQTPRVTISDSGANGAQALAETVPDRGACA